MHRSTYLALSSVSSNILCDRRQRQSCQQPAEGAARQCQRPLVFRGDLTDDRKTEAGARLALVQPPPALQRLLDLVRLQPRAVVLDLQQHPAAALNVAVVLRIRRRDRVGIASGSSSVALCTSMSPSKITSLV